MIKKLFPENIFEYGFLKGQKLTCIFAAANGEVAQVVLTDDQSHRQHADKQSFVGIRAGLDRPLDLIQK